MTSQQKEPEQPENKMTWWERPSIQYAFSHPLIRSRMEKLMGTCIVNLTDRDFMMRLQERILEEYAESMDKRVKQREEEELERVKNLVLMGKIPMSQAPPEMADHPVMLIEKYCNKLIAERRAKIKIIKVKIPTYLYWDDTPDPESGLTIEKGHVFAAPHVKLCNPHERFLDPLPLDDEEELPQEEEEVLDDYMMTSEHYRNINYEDPLIEKLRYCETIDELYELADEIIGTLRVLNEAMRERSTRRDSTTTIATMLTIN